MFTFLKANVASLAASLCDFLMTMLLVQGCQVNVVTAAATGTVTGGIVNFSIGRHWVFRAGDTRRTQNAQRGTHNPIQHNKPYFSFNVKPFTLSFLYSAFSVKRFAFSILYFAFSVKRLAFSVTVRQLGKYALVWAGNLLLNTGGVYVFACQAGLHYAISKVVTSLLVAFLYNYPLQKHFVFSNNW